MIILFVKILLVGFFLNLFWEISHCVLYKTCHELPLKKFVLLILTMSLKDGFWIMLFYGVTVFLFQSIPILDNFWQLATFVGISILFSYVDERVSLARHRWEYTSSMPLIFGVGLTPLAEISATGVAAFFVVFT